MPLSMLELQLEDAYAASLWGGSIGGIVVGILVIVLMSLPLCCGVLGAIGIVLGVLALIIPLFGALGSCVPFVDAACNDACTPCTEEEKKVAPHQLSWEQQHQHEERCARLVDSRRLTEPDAATAACVLYQSVLGAIGIVLGVLALIIPLFGALGSCEKKIWADACQTLGIIFVYLVVFGWAACVLGIVGASLACCVCCQCCKAKLDDPAVKQGAPPVDAYAASLWGGSIGGIVVGILVIILMSLPLCCGVLKQYGKAGKDL
eukprot:s2395_g6.t1